MQRAVPLSKGELEKIHGERETREFIAKGIFKKVRDHPYPQYLKVTEIAEWSKTRSTTTTATRHHHSFISLSSVERLLHLYLSDYISACPVLFVVQVGALKRFDSVVIPFGSIQLRFDWVCFDSVFGDSIPFGFVPLVCI